jgi:hypothetical protein
MTSSMPARCLPHRRTPPEAVDGDSRREWVLCADKPAGESKPVVRPEFLHTRPNRRNTAFDSPPSSVRGARLQNVSWPGLRQFLHHPQSSDSGFESDLSRRSSRSVTTFTSLRPALLPRERIRSFSRCASVRVWGGITAFGKANQNTPRYRSALRPAQLCRSNVIQ